jgi:hypothetical protein
LANLLHRVVAVNEKVGRRLVRRIPDSLGAAPQESDVAGQEDPPLVPRSTEQGIIFRPTVLGIVPQNAKPCGQPPEHRTGEKPRRPA